ncbi:hypothetical protein BXT86_03560 [candidate division WOR-3 bacterium 4484_100]|uniref:Secretion system C-terminal sorting domain-containing protein n=1 Tax=candidate division WOR-3 bacterium 4484_100 TaxID=1936077 RepID=A0A1V4QFH3_UNCW3|nr:MAG: hypothetical protein BXT86_03560 [candidate division WOR-3 bacterium 4484_100]
MIIFCIILLGFIYEDADSLIVNNDSLLICGLHQYNVKVDLINNAQITVRTWNGSDSSGWLQFKAPYIHINNSSILGPGCGYSGGDNSHPDGAGPGYGSAGTTGGGGGGAYGGAGGDGGDTNPGIGGQPYGSQTDTLIQMGSGGGAGRLSEVDGFGGAGGGMVYLYGSIISIDSSYINVPGQNGFDGSLEAGAGGSGGGVLIRGDTLHLYSLNINSSGGSGGDGAFGGGGGGGGGRIKIFFINLLDTLNLSLSVQPGSPGTGSYGNPQPGEEGTIHISPIVSIAQQKNNFNRTWRVYPSLSDKYINVDTDDNRFIIYNAEGRVVKRITLHKKKKVDLRCLKSGVYFIKPQSVNTVCAKIVVIR